MARGLPCADHMMVVRTLPMRLGPYLLTECLGRGGMAAVYKGKRRGASGFEKSVVVKTLLPEHRRNTQFVRMFKEEARLCAQLQHANVVRVHDFGVIADTPFLEMENLSGWNLKQLWDAAAARHELVPLPVTLALLGEACRGLAYAHSFVDDAGVHRPIIHRDVSPANVMICRDGSVKLVDFGLARLTRGETLAIDTFQGKLAYMSPEQLERRQLDRRADVFALGVTLHELLTGRRLFGVGDDRQTLRRLQTLVIDPPSAVNPEVPAAVDVIVLRALHRDPDQRYPSAAEMLAALDQVSGMMASRARLLSYLGAVAPHVFTRPCDECGGPVVWGADCPVCKTRLDDVSELMGDDCLDEKDFPSPSPSLSSLVPVPPDQLGWSRRRWLILKLTLCILWRRLDVWIAVQRLHALERKQKTRIPDPLSP
jgi:serine/threonine protein kinase